MRIFSSLFMISALLVTGCSNVKQHLSREDARRLAGPAFMNERQMDMGDYSLTLQERIHDRGGVAHVYIEGDDSYGARDKTSETLIGLHLASRDRAKNLIYVSRPCQFDRIDPKWGAPWLTGQDKADEEEECDMKYLQSHRFSSKVVSDYQTVLDDLKKRWGVSGFHLYGHSGGGAIAALLAYERKDVLSLTTVSGILDHRVYSGVAPHGSENPFFGSMSESANPADIAHALRGLPQHHYVGAADNSMPAASLFGYLQRMGPTNCVRYTLIQENGYTKGWVKKWPGLLRDKPICAGPIRDVMITNDLTQPR